MRHPLPRSTVAASALLVAVVNAHAQSPSRAECETANPASWGRAGKDVVWVPTSEAVVDAMLTMARVSPRDLVADLGAGDGRIAIAAARPPFGARAIGIEYDPDLARRAQCLVQAEGVADRARIVEGDIFEEDFSGASVVTLYLLPQLNLCVRHRILAMEPGTRVVSHQYSMADWEPDSSAKVQGRDVFLWTVPARVGGVWEFRDRQGTSFTIELRQSFGKLGGEITRGRVREPLLSATVRGHDLRFTFDTAGVNVEFAGTVHSGEIAGVLSNGTDGAPVETVGRLLGELQAAPWAEMPSVCDRYYGR